MSEIIKISDEDIKKCKKFANEVVTETYNRFHQNKQIRTERIFYGKLGEVIFLKFLLSRDIFPEVNDMFKVFSGETNVDKFDFITKHGKKIDIKTAYEDYHKRILIPFDQFENEKAKDFYVGIKVNLRYLVAEILGFCDKKKLQENGKINFGEGFAYWEYLNNLKPISELIQFL
jgi:hypothetical protein